jgi:hypothetical protein
MTSFDTIEDAQEAAKRNLWLHFTRMSAYTDADVPVIVRGSGAYVYDQHGKRYLDGLSATAAPRSPRPEPARRPSSRTSRCGPTRTPRPSSWPPGWPRWPPGR